MFNRVNIHLVSYHPIKQPHDVKHVQLPPTHPYIQPEVLDLSSRRSPDLHVQFSFAKIQPSQIEHPQTKTFSTANNENINLLIDHSSASFYV